ncbi:hypothetical protein DMH26_00300 [Streptomyces sp. WAC 05379]|uniref:hypothetical protein n=1 Tax=Streptomyces sp. WAC 05379 TaxID=2203207 RepID=UPI000F74206D|nr:hypothetical protein [Streptomyces sp. WAC 05379]RSO09982.1 hypothetical protein DMH26_00300 [Streptomyces sp. WAC 05379]
MWFRRGIRQLPRRVVPELDDSELSRVLSHLDAQISAQGDNLAQANDRGALTYPIEQTLRDSGRDWDRRIHRLLVLSSLREAPVLARQWHTRKPDCPDALLFEAYAGLAQHGSGGAAHNLGPVIALCRQAAKLLPDDPAPWVALLTCYRLIRAATADVRSVWEGVKTRDPWNREAHLQVLHYLSPRECGSHATMLQFTDAVRTQAPPRSPVESLALLASLTQYLALREADGITALTAHRHWNQPYQRALVDHALATWTQPGHLTHAAALTDLNVLAYVLIKAMRLRDASTVLQAIGPVVTAWPWQEDGPPVETFRDWSRRAQRAAQQR